MQDCGTNVYHLLLTPKQDIEDPETPLLLNYRFVNVLVHNSICRRAQGPIWHSRLARMHYTIPSQLNLEESDADNN